jgi:hypothetical protein
VKDPDGRLGSARACSEGAGGKPETSEGAPVGAPDGLGGAPENGGKPDIGSSLALDGLGGSPEKGRGAPDPAGGSPLAAPEGVGGARDPEGLFNALATRLSEARGVPEGWGGGTPLNELLGLGGTPENAEGRPENDPGGPEGTLVPVG